MNKKHYRYIALFSYFLINSVQAGAWVQNAGEGLNIFTVRRYLSDQYWTPGGRLIGSPTYAKNEADEYLEYGVTNKLTMGVALSALVSHTPSMNTQGGWDDTLLYGRYLFWSSGTSVASVQLSADKLGRAASFDIPPQNSSFNSSEEVLIGTSGQFKGPTRRFWFADASLGLTQRYSAGNQLLIYLEAGYKFDDEKAWLFLQEYNTFSLDHINYPQGSNYNLFTISPSVLYWPTKNFALQLGISQDLYGQNVGKGREVFLASWIRFGDCHS